MAPSETSPDAPRAATRGLPRSVREPLILEVAGQAFAEGGYDHASMDRIADLAGVSKPMLYEYFGSKEGLYLAYVDRTGGELVERLGAAEARARADAEARPRAVVRAFFSFVEQYRDGWTVLFRELTVRRPLGERVAAVRARIVEEVRRMIEDLEPGLVAPASEAVAEALVGAGESLANWWLQRSDVSRDDVVDWYVGLAGAALAAAPRPVGSALGS